MFCHLIGRRRDGPLLSTVVNMATLAEAVSEGIRAHRARRQLSQRELGKAVGMHERTISNLELGRRPVTLDGELLALCRALDVTFAELVAFADADDLRALGLR